jgi:hypothetical protein
MGRFQKPVSTDVGFDKTGFGLKAGLRIEGKSGLKMSFSLKSMLAG